MTTSLQVNDSGTGTLLYMAFELSDKKWRVAFGDGDRQR